MLLLHVTRAVEAQKTLPLVEALHAKKITAGMKYAVSTGNWGIQKQASQNGVAQILTRMNYLATLSHLRRINTPINRDGKLPKPRQLSASHCGVLCPVETPEGQACGLVENLALLSYTRLGSDCNYVTEALQARGKLAPLEEPRAGRWRVVVNGSVEGYCDDGAALVRQLRAWRRSMTLPPDTSVIADVDQNLVFVDTDAGCLLRPLFVRRQLHMLPEIMRRTGPSQLWSELLARGVVELVDKSEERNISLTATHMELHPSCLLGVCAGLIPFLSAPDAAGARPPITTRRRGTSTSPPCPSRPWASSACAPTTASTQWRTPCTTLRNPSCRPACTRSASARSCPPAPTSWWQCSPTPASTRRTA
jgi:DNA-directed RNA polymerase II subunit RPB2